MILINVMKQKELSTIQKIKLSLICSNKNNQSKIYISKIQDIDLDIDLCVATLSFRNRN